MIEGDGHERLREQFKNLKAVWSARDCGCEALRRTLTHPK